MKVGFNILLGCTFAAIAMQADALQITATGCPADTGSGGTYYTDSGGAAWTCWTSEGAYQEPVGNSGHLKEIKNPDAANVSSITGVMVDLYYKNEIDTDETGTGGWTNHYDTMFANTATNPEDATISHTGGSALSCPECFVLVKDGSTTPAWYLFDIGYWNGIDPIELLDFWVGNGAISHVSIFAAPGQVPEPGPLALMAIGFLGMGHRLRHCRMYRPLLRRSTTLDQEDLNQFELYKSRSLYENESRPRCRRIRRNSCPPLYQQTQV